MQQQIQQSVHMNWFQRHLNGTIILFSLIYRAIGFGIKIFSSPDSPILKIILKCSNPLLFVAPLLSDKNMSYMATGLYDIVGIIIGLFISGWVIRQKRRSLWWLLLFFVPLGWLGLLKLENRNSNVRG